MASPFCLPKLQVCAVTALLGMVVRVSVLVRSYSYSPEQALAGHWLVWPVIPWNFLPGKSPLC